MPSYIWYQDMADFADQVSDERDGRRLARALQGKGAFRDARADRRAVEWLADNSLVDHDAATRFLEAHPEPSAP